MAERIGIFGGTFDPPHLGHLILAECAVSALNLSRVLFVLTADPPHKRDHTITPITHRLPMIERAIAGNSCFELSRIDIDRPGPHYTSDTVRLLHEQFSDAQLFFLLGGDSLHDLPTWHDPVAIVAHVTLAVMRRPADHVEISQLIAQMPNVAGHFQFVDAPTIGISATQIRERLHAGHSIRYQVPEAVIMYIQQHRLYV